MVDAVRLLIGGAMLLASGAGCAAHTAEPGEAERDRDRPGRVEPKAVLHEEARPGVFAVAFAPDGRTVASAGASRTVRLWEPSGGRPAVVLGRHPGTVHDLAYSRDGRRLAAGGDVLRVKTRGQRQPAAETDGAVVVWELGEKPTETVLQVPASPPPYAHFTDSDAVRTLAFAPDGRSLLAGATRQFFDRGSVGAVVRWEADSGKVLSVQPAGRSDNPDRVWAIIRGPGERVPAAAFVAGGKRVASTDGRWVVVGNPGGGEQEVALYTPDADEAFVGTISCLTASADGRLVAAGRYRQPRGAGPEGGPSNVFVWDVEAGKRVADLQGHTCGVAAVAFAPDGKALVSVDREGMARLWDVAAGRELAAWQAHEGPAYTVAVSPDGKSIATGGNDGAVRLWDVAAVTARKGQR